MAVCSVFLSPAIVISFAAPFAIFVLFKINYSMPRCIIQTKSPCKSETEATLKKCQSVILATSVAGMEDTPRQTA
ncbi:hypothetical protein B0I37DRAFT_163532 [Chaetomium sp. MPI-CAGE-AT-0009]|nr:hypothetical protein B0I37DRAFT_163532 [Chaetomium sp. MPI-CAGE-AT-0009]